MGFNTTVLILNDALNSLEDDTQFNGKLAAAIRALQLRRPVEVSIGGHVNGCIAIESHHADQMLPLLVGGNTAHVIRDTYIHWDKDGMEEELLRALAKKHGYELRRKRA